MPVNVKVSQLKYKNGSGAYVGINGFSERATSEEIAEIEAKGAATLASIPADYTTLSNNVSDLKSALNANVDFKLEIIDGEYFAKWGEIVEDAAACRTNYIPVIPGETIITLAFANANVYEVAFFDINKNLDATNSILGNRNPNTRELVVPDNDYYVMLTCYGKNNKNTIGFAKASKRYDFDYSAELMNALSDGQRIGTTNSGWYYSSPVFLKVEDANGRCTDMIPVYQGQTLEYQTFLTDAGYELVYFSEYKTPLPTISIVGNSSRDKKTVIVPQKARYVRLFSYNEVGAYIKLRQKDGIKDDVVFAYMTLSGYRAPNGDVTPDESGLRTELVPIEKGSIIEYITSIGSAGNKLSFFDENKKYIDFVLGGSGNKKISTYTVDDDRYRFVELGSYNYKGYLSVYRNRFVKNYYDRLAAFSGGNNTFSIFRKFVVCGDSLSVGHVDYGDSHTSPNINYSWGQFMARDYGSVCINCGSSGLSAESWLTNANGLAKMQAEGNKGQAYIIGLGANEQTGNIGGPETLDDTTTFYGAYKAIYDAIRALNPTAKIFMFTLPTHWGAEWSAVNEGVRYIVDNVGDSATYLIDFANDYAKYFNAFPIAQTQTTHYLPAGYKMISKVIEYALDRVIVEDPTGFGNVHLIPYDE